MNILFHDIDGCLNTEDGEPIDNYGGALAPAQLAALSELGRMLDSSAIDILALNTGRGLLATLPVAEAIGSKRLRYLLSEHGAVGYDMEKRAEFDVGALARASGSAEIAEAYASLSEFHELMDWYLDAGHQKIAERLGSEVAVLPKTANLTFVTPEGATQDEMFAAAKALVEQDSPFAAERFVFHNSGSDGFVDVMSRIDKGHGTRLIANRDAHGAVRTFAVGNGINDLPMLQEVDVPICPANAEQGVKALCQGRGGLVSAHRYVRATVEWLRDFG